MPAAHPPSPWSRWSSSASAWTACCSFCRCAPRLWCWSASLMPASCAWCLRCFAWGRFGFSVPRCGCCEWCCLRCRRMRLGRRSVKQSPRTQSQGRACCRACWTSCPPWCARWAWPRTLPPTTRLHARSLVASAPATCISRLPPRRWRCCGPCSTTRASGGGSRSTLPSGQR